MCNSNTAWDERVKGFKVLLYSQCYSSPRICRRLLFHDSCHKFTKMLFYIIDAVAYFSSFKFLLLHNPSASVATPLSDRLVILTPWSKSCYDSPQVKRMKR